MRITALLSTALVLTASLSGLGDGGEVRSGGTLVVVERAGSGFIDSLRFFSRELLRAREGFVGAELALVPAPPKGSPLDALFPCSRAETLPARILHVRRAGAGLEVVGEYVGFSLRLPFRRRILPAPSHPDGVRVEEVVDLSRISADRLLAGWRFRLPVVVSPDEHLRMFAFAGQHRVEMFRMDMNDEPRTNQYISDSRAFHPYWDIGGLLVRERSYRIWRANHADTLAYPVEEGLRSPGWADYSEPEWGLTVLAEGPAPFALIIDARRGTFTIDPWPRSEPPVAGADLGRRTFRFTVIPHRTSWPALHRCELDPSRYRQLLDYLNRTGSARYTFLDFALRTLGLVFPPGRKDSRQMEEVFRRLVVKERVQPSVLLRLFYRYDAWRMQGIVRDLLGKRVPRRRPFAHWEAEAREILSAVQTGKPLPPRASK